MPNFSSLVGRGIKDFCKIFAPGSAWLSEDGNTVSMSSVVGETRQLLWRVWIPPGTRSLQATMFAFASPPACKVLMRMHQPPVGDLDSVSPANAAAVNLSDVLTSLLQGNEVPCYAPPEAGAVKLSDGRIDSPVVTTTGGWLYIHVLQAPGDRIYELMVRVTADAALYRAWYSTAVWDDDGNPVGGVSKPVKPAEPITPAKTFEDDLLERIVKSGLGASLHTLAGTKTDADLISVAQSSGTWPALVKLIKSYTEGLEL